MHQRGADPFLRVGQINMVNLGTRGHHRANRAFGQLQHTADHDPLTSMEDLFSLPAFEHVGDFLTHFILVQLATAQQAHHRMGRALTHRP